MGSAAGTGSRAKTMCVMEPTGIRDRFFQHLHYTRCKRVEEASAYDYWISLAGCCRDLGVERLLQTRAQRAAAIPKAVSYLSMEYLLGRLLRQNMLALCAEDAATALVRELGLDLRELSALEPDAGLGNGGLGRLAACFMESLATLEYPAVGYGLRYAHGMFRQDFDNGWQVEKPDDWLRLPNPWEIARPEDTVMVLAYGRVENVKAGWGREEPVWCDWQMFEGVPHDIPVLGHGVGTANVLRLWSSRATQGFRLDVFNRGDYVTAVSEKNWAENITNVLYPSDNTHAGRELRLLQEYFLVACSVRDIVRRYAATRQPWARLPDYHAVQMNDTHPALTVAELMRFLIDEQGVPLDTAWDITVRTLGYTNHTLLPEALEKWPVPLLERVLPRHLQLIYSLNHRFLERVRLQGGIEEESVAALSAIEEGPVKHVRMANLALMGSHAVNGVAALHTELIKSRVFAPQHRLWPERFVNITNGVSPRRWLLECNPSLAALITEAVGPTWVRDLDVLRGLEPRAEDAGFRDAFRAVKLENKKQLADLIRRSTGLRVDPAALFDVQIKRLHEYKRQLLNVMHIITLWQRLRDNPAAAPVPRVFLFGAKAAPGYHMAKLIIKLIHSVAATVNADPAMRGLLQVVYLPDYCVSLAERMIPAADLSEQISTAGTEASGTGNMKLALNGALTIGTWDGANIEIAEQVGPENLYLFGHRAHELDSLRAAGYRPAEWAAGDPELGRVVATFAENPFDPAHPGQFLEIHRSLLDWGDHYYHLADYRAYVDRQAEAAACFADGAAWWRKSVLNVARMGYFSSDRSIREYAERIWYLRRQPVGAAPVP